MSTFLKKTLWLVPLCFLGAAPMQVDFFHGAVGLTEAIAKDEKKPIPAETERHLKFAKKYRTQGRYELARQHYLLALAASNTTSLRDAIQRDLQEVDLQIKTLR